MNIQRQRQCSKMLSSLPQPNNDFFNKLAMSLGPTVNDVMQRGKRTVLNMMAKRMSNDDAQIMLQHWSSFVNKGTVNDIQNEIKTIEAVKSVIKPIDNKDSLVVKSNNNEISKSIKENYENIHLLHPIFGKLVCDIGFKKIYLTNVKSLVHAPVWEKQRILRPERCARIASSKIQKGSKSLPGVISMYLDKVSGKFGIIDGQHRAGALLIMAQQGHWNEYERNILVDVFITESDKEISDLFKDINSAEPVRLVDMPDDGMENENEKNILDEATDILQKQFPEMFKSSTRCKIPHLNVDIFRDEIFQNEIIVTHKIKSADALLKFFLSKNQKLSKRTDEEWLNLNGGIGNKTIEQALKKARAHNFFLGLDKNWFNNH